MNKQAIIIGDVHGCLTTLKNLLNSIPDIQNKHVIFVGDLIDRGPQSAEVIEFVRQNNYDCVLGNHELMMLEENGYPFYQSITNNWGDNGGLTTYKSYSNNNNLIKEHLEWIKTLPYYKIYDDFIDDKGRKLLVSHSYASEFLDDIFDIQKQIDNKDFHYATEKQLNGQLKLQKSNILWNRKFPVIKDKEFFNVFGHTPTTYWVEKYLDRNFTSIWFDGVMVDSDIGFADVDTGCVYQNKLSALEFPSMKVYTTPYKN